MKMCIFNGEFALPGYETSENGVDWVCGRRGTTDGIYDWKFEQKSVLKLLSGNVAYGGLFSMRTPPLHPTKSVYIYFETENILHINHFECSGEFRVHSCTYRVEQAAEAEYRLYPLDDARSEHANFRMNIRACFEICNFVLLRSFRFIFSRKFVTRESPCAAFPRKNDLENNKK